MVERFRVSHIARLVVIRDRALYVGPYCIVHGEFPGNTGGIVESGEKLKKRMRR